MTQALYDDLASWWPLISAPEEYTEEFEFFFPLLEASGAKPGAAMLELGSGGGNNASHLRTRYKMTLVDLAPRMLEVSRALNPECEHVVGDMRTARLGRTFDAVFVHDAIMYMTTEADLRAAMTTAFEHLREGGIAMFAPDYVRETFEPSHDAGGNDGAERAARYLEWCFDPDPSDTTYIADYAFMLRDERGEARTVHDRHIEGLFPRATWRELLASVGFINVESHVDAYRRDIFVARRPLRR
jgi:SAM-dependent methyltransferase